jgi:hypothetical protein
MQLFEDPVWQMSFGERAAMEGLLSARKPALAIEIGTAEGASLRRIAAHAAEVHSFDLVLPSEDLPDHVHLHTGDSHALLPQVLDQLAADGRNVSFVLVDGDHSSEGVRADVMALLTSPAIADTVIVMHDIANERVRAGLDAVPYDAFPKVAHVDLDFVPGYMGRDRFTGELWGGLGLIVVAADRPAYGSGPAVQTIRHHGGELLAIARDVVGGRAPDAGPAGHDPRARQLSDAYRQIDALEARVAELQARTADLAAQVEHHRALVRDLMTSASWRVTTPLRLAKRAASRVRR